MTHDSATSATPLHPLMTVEETAAYLRIPVATLYAWRSRGQGPRSSRVGRYVRYRRVDVEAFLDQSAA